MALLARQQPYKTASVFYVKHSLEYNQRCLQFKTLTLQRFNLIDFTEICPDDVNVCEEVHEKYKIRHMVLVSIHKFLMRFV